MRAIIKGPYFSCLLGAILLLSGLCEIADFALESWIHVVIGAEHGVLMWGLGQVLKSLVDIAEGLEGLAGS